MFIFVFVLNVGRYGVDGVLLLWFKDKLFINKIIEIKDVV